MKDFPVAAVLPVPSDIGYEDYSRLLSGVIRDATTSSIKIKSVDEFTSRNSRAADTACVAPVQEELDGFFSRDVFRLVQKSSLPAKPNLPGGRIIRCVKNVGTSSEKYKARIVVQGHRDVEIFLLIYDSATLRQSSLSVILSIASSFHLPFWPLGINPTYTRSVPTTRNVHFRPDPAFGVGPSMVFNMASPIWIC